MEAKVSQGLQLGTWINPQKFVKKPSTSLQFLHKYEDQRWDTRPGSCRLPTKKGKLHTTLVLKVSCSSENISASVLNSESIPTLLGESQILKNKSEEIKPCLNGRCIYLVGMMGSGKTTIGKVMSEALGYSFCDCDVLIEQAAGGTTVADIFKLHGESFFRDHETEVLQRLSYKDRLVISTGGGAVVRPINWRHMQKGVSVWLDVPLEALARRIVAVGTGSRPLLKHDCGDPYSKTMKRLSTLYEERGESYAKANARVSVESIATKFGYEDVCNVTPTAIAIEALLQIEKFLRE